MPPIDQITAFVAANPGATAVICASGLVLLVLTFFALRAAYRALAWGAKHALSATRKVTEGRPAEDSLTIAAAAIATGVSAQGMWKFSGDVLGFDGPLRLLLFAFIEVAVITSAVRARRNMRENFSAGIDGIAVWVLTSLSAVLSALDADSIPGAIFRLAAPLVAAWLWERGMAVERHRLTGRGRIHWRLTLERVMVWFGLAEAEDRTASEVDVHRRLTRIARAAVKVRELQDAGVYGRKLAAAQSRLRAALEQGEEHTDLATNPDTKRILLDKVTALRSGSHLAGLPDIDPWAGVDHPAAKTRDDLPGSRLLAAGLSKWSQEMLREPADVVAARGLGRGQDASGTATTPAAVIPAPRRRIMGDPGSPYPIGRLVPFEVWTRPERRPLDGRFPLPPADGNPDGRTGNGTGPGGRGDGKGTRPGPGQDDDQKKPTEQDRRRVAQWWVKRVKAGEVLSKWTLADRTGFRPTWCGDRIAEGKEILARQGWTFAPDGRPIRPADTDADLVASTSRPAAVQRSVNGSAPAAS
ncbi:hypothetical protein ACFFWE_10085 [Sphaerisporangium melleum]|uniref:hypothetical protein n=1 Tax=Sphaerisporangium melleum TaxID=321316 RepID=UPI00166C262A|nr:hypothetical protein [Sphaerisporangium melleum]